MKGYSFGPRGPNTSSIARPKIGNVPYGYAINACTVPGTVALTFDDGPFDYTEQILDILDGLNVTATFFVSGNNKAKGHIDDITTKWPRILSRMYGAGHQIGSHAWTHRNLNAQQQERPERKSFNDAVRMTEIMYNEMAFRNLFGWIPTYMRPPYLECSEKSGCLKFMGDWGYHVITSNVDTKDYKFDDANLIENSRKLFRESISADPLLHNYIVLAHDVHYQTVVNLTAYMVQLATGLGYNLVTVGQCLGDAKENWYRAAR